MRDLARDLRYGLRALLKNPGYSTAAVLALALGIGLSTAMFSIVYGAMLRSLPFDESQRILFIGNANPSRDEQRLSVHLHDFLEYRARQTSFEALGAYYNGTLNLSGAGAGSSERPERFDGAFMTAETLPQLRVQPILGRGFQPGDCAPGAEPVVLLGWGVWKSRYGGDRGVLGRPVRVNGTPGTIVGVLPQGFSFPDSEQVWTTLRLDPLRIERGQGQTLDVIGRLKPGVSLAAARAEIATLAKGLAVQHPQSNKGLEATVVTLGDHFMDGEVRKLLWVMLAACLFVLLIACTNVASLMVARASRRTREIAIRAALGARRSRIVVQLLAESLLLSLVGAVLGILLAREGVRLFNDAIAVSNPPFWLRIAIDPAALAFALGMTLVAALLSGLVPALQASRTDITEVLKDEGRGSSSLRVGLFTRIVVIAEVAVSCLLLVATGLMVNSVVRTRLMTFGMRSEGLLTARIALFEGPYPDEASRVRFFDKLALRLAESPWAEAAAAGNALPGNGSEAVRYAMPGKAYPSEREKPLAHQADVSAGYFGTLGIRRLAGRDFGPQDTAASLPVVVVNKSLADKEWPGQDPLGRQFQRAAAPGGKPEPWRTVVGVVADARMGGLGGPDPAGPEGFYLPLAQECPGFAYTIVRIRQGRPEAFGDSLRAAVAGIDRDLPLYWVYSMQEVLERARFFPNLFGALFAIFGVSALLLAGVGIFGVISFSVSQRTQEIGIRMALGARKGGVLGLILGRGMLQLAIGLVLGLLAAWPAAKLLAVVLVGVEPNDPLTFGAVAAVLALVAFFACWLPAQRAAETDPLVAIRYD